MDDEVDDPIEEPAQDPINLQVNVAHRHLDGFKVGVDDAFLGGDHEVRIDHDFLNLHGPRKIRAKVDAQHLALALELQIDVEILDDRVQVKAAPNGR